MRTPIALAVNVERHEQLALREGMAGQTKNRAVRIALTMQSHIETDAALNVGSTMPGRRSRSA